ncbi:MAG: pyridoxamine 5'-phosphate oxidase family protein [Bacteroidales bacterium]|nr:pyridoxamine 5'-phosphate oxidase family protein [Bacteroidales bacterium]
MTKISEKKIIDFIKKHHVMTIATSVDNKPWCCNCFYAFDKEKTCLIFSSDLKTRHAQEAVINKQVAGSIVLETKIIGKIQGIQFSGNMFIPENEMLAEANSLYFKTFPFALLKDTFLWQLDIEYIKFTDNSLGFGKKIIWEKPLSL